MSYDFFPKKAMVPSLRYLIIVEKLHRVYHIIYPFRIYPNRFIYLRAGWLGHHVDVNFKCINCLSFFIYV